MFGKLNLEGKNGFSNWYLIIGAGLGIGIAVGWLLVHDQSAPDNKPVEKNLEVTTEHFATDNITEEVGSIALRYAKAYQTGEWETILDTTEWMRQRMNRIRSKAAAEDEIERTKIELKRRILERPEEGNILREEGIEDALVFRPEAKVELIGIDKGRDDLEKPVRGRAWLRVTYLKPERAPIGPKGIPIHAMDVGLNVSQEGTILKAGIKGNSEVDMGSIDYIWPTTKGDDNHATSKL